MIIWLSSYPKSGNTLVRSLLSAYLFTEDGKFNFESLKNISLFPDITFFKKLGVNVENDDDVLKNYIRAQEEINKKNIFIRFNRVYWRDNFEYFKKR